MAYRIEDMLSELDIDELERLKEFIDLLIVDKKEHEEGD